MVIDFGRDISVKTGLVAAFTLAGSQHKCAKDPRMSDKNLVNFGRVTTEFCWRVFADRAYAGLCHASS